MGGFRKGGAFVLAVDTASTQSFSAPTWSVVNIEGDNDHKNNWETEKVQLRSLHPFEGELPGSRILGDEFKVLYENTPAAALAKLIEHMNSGEPCHVWVGDGATDVAGTKYTHYWALVSSMDRSEAFKDTVGLKIKLAVHGLSPNKPEDDEV